MLRDKCGGWFKAIKNYMQEIKVESFVVSSHSILIVIQGQSGLFWQAQGLLGIHIQVQTTWKHLDLFASNPRDPDYSQKWLHMEPLQANNVNIWLNRRFLLLPQLGLGLSRSVRQVHRPTFGSVNISAYLVASIFIETSILHLMGEY